MNPDFWLNRWEKGEIGFHRDEIHPYLSEFWPSLKTCRRVFVPLCGKSLDMHWLRQQGVAVLGVELSQLAVKDFFKAAVPTKAKLGTLDSYKASEIEILCGDFFELAPAHVMGCDVIYDRASLIAMPPELRSKYGQQIKRLFPQGARILLVTLEYPQVEMTGTPFSVSEDEVYELYAGSMIETLTRRDVLKDNERFRQRGVSELFENAYLITL